jgi:hypothetical protein
MFESHHFGSTRDISVNDCYRKYGIITSQSLLQDEDEPVPSWTEEKRLCTVWTMKENKS